MSQQLYKAVYFDDYKNGEGKPKSFSIAFTEDETDLFKKVGRLSSYSIKKILQCDTYSELKNRAEHDGRTVNQYAKRTLSQQIGVVHIPTFKTRDVTFGNSKTVPFQRWYPYIEGYSPSFVDSLIDNFCPDASLIYEPFAGTGTTIFSADKKGIPTIYSEVNPILQYLIDAKLKVQRLPQNKRQILSASLISLADNILEDISHLEPSSDLKKSYSSVFKSSIYFPEDQLDKILRLRTFIDSFNDSDDALIVSLLNIAVFSCLIPVSYLKKQGDLRFKTEREKQTEMLFLEDVLPAKIHEIAEDVANCDIKINHRHRLIQENAKQIGQSHLKHKIDAVITSPPYLNGTNYFRNTKLELWFLSYLKTDKDLRKYRDQALTSGINDVKLEYSSQVQPFNSRLYDETMAELDANAYDRRIPVMAKCYFKEMYEVFSGLCDNLNDNADILIDLGDSIFSGVHIKTDLILVDIIRPLGYQLINRQVLRQRRSRNGDLISQVLLVMKYNRKS